MDPLIQKLLADQREGRKAEYSKLTPQQGEKRTAQYLAEQNDDRVLEDMVKQARTGMMGTL
jgi:hypothetical protein